tara:strand:- start:21 stop:236 length:216 start_codon:yes stop_codon:yes gene_type:complete
MAQASKQGTVTRTEGDPSSIKDMQRYYKNEQMVPFIFGSDTDKEFRGVLYVKKSLLSTWDPDGQIIEISGD